MSSAQWADRQRDHELVAKFKRFIVGSLAVHVVAIAIAMLVGYINFRPDYSDSAMIVNFRGRPGPKAKGVAGPRPPAPKPQAAATPPAPQPEPKPEPRPETRPVPKPEPKPEPKPDMKAVSPDKSKEPKKPDPKKPDPKAEPKPETPPKPEPPKKPEPRDLDAPGVAPGNDDIALARSMMNRGKGGVGDGDGGGGDFDGVEGYEGDEALGLYHQEGFAEVIIETWKVPPDFSIRSDLMVLVEIKVDNKGKVLEAKIVQASGNSELDRSVLKLFEDLKAMKDIPAPPKPSREGFYLLRYSLIPGGEG